MIFKNLTERHCKGIPITRKRGNHCNKRSLTPQSSVRDDTEVKGTPKRVSFRKGCHSEKGFIPREVKQRGISGSNRFLLVPRRNDT